MSFHFTGSKKFTPTEEEMNSVKDDDYDALQKLATNYKGNNWRLSLTCLFKAKDLLYVKGTAPVLEQITRFPVFLQQAGYFEEAKYELQELFEQAEEYAKSEVKLIRKHKRIFKRYFKALYLEHLFDKASLIYKRQKLLRESNELLQISLAYRKEGESLRQNIDQIEEKELREFEEESKALSQSLSDTYIDELIAQSEEQNRKQNNFSLAMKSIVGFLIIVLLYMFFS